MNALDLGMPLTLIGEAVFARCLSAMKDERVAASHLLKGPKTEFRGDRHAYIDYIGQALYSSKVISYAQGFMLMEQAARDYGWQLNYGGVALMWRGGALFAVNSLVKLKKHSRKIRH